MENEIIKVENEEVVKSQDIDLGTIITGAIKIPGVKVDRKKFLAEIFANKTSDIQQILDVGPIAAGVDEKTLKQMATKLILDRTTMSSITSFAMGIPGGLAMVATIPGDTLQFYGVALKLAQELTYLYGATDMWVNNEINEEMIRSQFILYCGVMFGVSGAVEGVRILSAQMAKTALKKLPQKALTKTFWYPIIKKIGTSVGVRITKKSFTAGVSKAVPVIGGVVSGVLTFVSMKPMAEKLLKTLEDATFNYSEEEFKKDIDVIEKIEEEYSSKEEIKEKKSIIDKSKEKLSGLFKKRPKQQSDDYEKIKKLKELLDMGAISQEEFDKKKNQILDL